MNRRNSRLNFTPLGQALRNSRLNDTQSPQGSRLEYPSPPF